MCCGCGCGHRGHGAGWCHEPFRGQPPLMTVEEEVKTLEELRKDLEDRLNRVNKRLEALKQ